MWHAENNTGTSIIIGMREGIIQDMNPEKIATETSEGGGMIGEHHCSIGRLGPHDNHQLWTRPFAHYLRLGGPLSTPDVIVQGAWYSGPGVEVRPCLNCLYC